MILSFLLFYESVMLMFVLVCCDLGLVSNLSISDGGGLTVGE